MGEYDLPPAWWKLWMSLSRELPDTVAFKLLDHLTQTYPFFHLIFFLPETKSWETHIHGHHLRGQRTVQPIR
jgi:hypothetical protein